VLQHLPIIGILAAFVDNMLSVDITRPKNDCQHKINIVSTEHQQSINDFHYCICDNPRPMLVHLPILEVLPTIVGNMLNVDIATPKNDHQLSTNRASAILIGATVIIRELCYSIYP
jgi:hypothetical protein